MNIVKLENLSSCDFDCDSGKVRVKVSSATISSTGQNIPSPYNSIVGTIPSNLKEGANVTEVFDDGIGFWKQTSCDSSNYTWSSPVVYKGDINTIVENQSLPYTLQLGDEGKYIRVSSPTPGSVIIPENSSTPFPIGTTITIIQSDVGIISIDVVQPTPIIINSYNGGNSTAGQYAVIQLIKVDIDEWDLIGGV